MMSRKKVGLIVNTKMFTTIDYSVSVSVYVRLFYHILWPEIAKVVFLNDFYVYRNFHVPFGRLEA